jgi:hypothetical protein
MVVVIALNNYRLSDEVYCQRHFNEVYRTAVSKNFEAQRVFLEVFAATTPVTPAMRDKAYSDYFASLQPIPLDNKCASL